MQAKAEFKKHYRTFEDCRKTLEATGAAVHKRWTKYYDLFDNVSKTVSNKFLAYMHRRGHSVSRGFGLVIERCHACISGIMIGALHYSVVL